MSRWIWHGWQSPEEKKLKDWCIDLLPPVSASRVSSNTFPLELFTARKMKLAPGLFQLHLASSRGGRGQGGRRGQGCAWPLGAELIPNCALPSLPPSFCPSISFFFSPTPSSFFSLSFFLLWPFLSHLSLPVLWDCHLTSVLLNNVLLFAEVALSPWVPEDSACRCTFKILHDLSI